MRILISAFFVTGVFFAQAQDTLSSRKTSIARAQLDAIKAALLDLAFEKGSLPETQQQFEHTLKELRGRDVPAYRLTAFDPWQERFQWKRSSTDEGELRSKGPDEELGTDDDIVLLTTAAKASKHPREVATRLRMANIELALQEYFLANAKYPAALTELVGRELPLSPPDLFAYSYSKRFPTKVISVNDAWGRPLICQVCGQDEYTLRSSGIDPSAPDDDIIGNNSVR